MNMQTQVEISIPNPHANGEVVNVEPLLRLLALYDNSLAKLATEIQDALDEMPYLLMKEEADFSGYVQAHGLLVKIRRTLS